MAKTHYDRAFAEFFPNLGEMTPSEALLAEAHFADSLRGRQAKLLDELDRAETELARGGPLVCKLLQPWINRIRRKAESIC